MAGRFLAAAACVGMVAPGLAQVPAPLRTVDGVTAGNSHWVARVPANWNGTLLLWSHGFAFARSDPPEIAPHDTESALLMRGYALLASTYSATGWAVEQGVPDQLAALDAFAAQVGRPRRTIAWGESMGGLVTSALIERHPDRFAGALVSCASSGGAVGMMNMALDGAFAFKALVAPRSDIAVVGTRDDRANLGKVAAAVEEAQKSAAGRARLALVGVLAGIPGWTIPGTPEPRPGDHEAQQAQIAKAIPMGVFLPRADQEARAGGIFSWNVGIDYSAQLARSGRRAMVRSLYRQAGLDLDADLARLNDTPRIASDPRAVAYMLRNFTPAGDVRVPVLTLHTTGDGLTSPSLARAYGETIAQAGNRPMVGHAWNARAGHCTSSGGETLAALEALEQRIATGGWQLSPALLNQSARRFGETAPTFVAHRPAPPLRPCRAGRGGCAGASPR